MKNLILLTALFHAPAALACGQSTHIWVGIHAVDHLPEGELKELMSQEAVFPWLVNGAMFPDGGYSPLTQNGYGETAHWEPFQTAWMARVRTDFGPDFTDPAADGRIAFLMGLAAHGLADQIFDGIYLTRSLFYDGQERWDRYGNVDTSTDIAMTAAVGPMPIVDDVVPYDDLVSTFANYGQPVDRSTIELGQLSLRIAVQYVGNVGQSAEAEEYKAQYPWANGHLTDPTKPGNAGCMSEAVAAYWLTLWDRLHERYDPDATPVIYTWPRPEEANHPHAASDIESQIGAVFARAVDTDTLGEGRIVVTDEEGAEHPVTWRMYYGDNTNVLNLWPTTDWADDMDYTVTVQPGVTSFDGEALGEPASFGFTTKEQLTPEAGGVGCEEGGCSTPGGGAAIWLALLTLPARRRRPKA